MTLSIQLLGVPEVLRDGAPLTIARRKSRALLYYLAARRAPTPRDQVIDLFWPDTSRAAAQQTLRATLYGLRKALGDALVAGEALAVDPAADVDVWQLDDALAAGADDALAAALARYRGDFLESFSLPDTPDFDDWAAATRERYRGAVAGGLAQLGHSYAARGAYDAALDALDRALALDPLQEDVQRDAMQVQYLAGDRVGAIRRYEQLVRRLDDELGVPPMAETRAIYDGIIKDEGRTPNAARNAEGGMLNAESLALRFSLPGGAGNASGVQRAALSVQKGVQRSDLPFTGRMIELQALRQLASSRQLVLVEGEPGIGKTRLAEEFLRGAGALALAGAARELDQALPYQPVVEALRTLVERPNWDQIRRQLSLPQVWAAEVGRLAPELARVAVAPQAAGAADEARLREGVSQLLRALARVQPVALFIDDLHWADAATLGLLGYLVRQQLVGVTLLAAARPPEPRSPLALLAQSLTREGRLARLPLARLGVEDTLALAQRLSPATPEELAAWLARNGEGNPYIIAELVRHAREEGILRPDGGLTSAALGGDSPVVPPTIYTLIAARLQRLSDPARRVLDTAVAVGREFACDVVAHAAALSEEAALDALDELGAAGLVRRLDGVRYAFDHSLTMEVAYKEVGEARHRLIHRRVAGALEALHRGALDDVAGLIATHYVEGGAPERATPYAMRAARRAAGLAAWTEAIGFYRQALAGMQDGGRAAALLELGEAYYRSGAHAQAGDAYREAADLARAHHDQAGVSAARLGQAQALISQGRFTDVIAIAREVAAAGDRDLAARAELMWGTALSLEGADLAGAAEHLRRAEALAAPAGAGADLAHAHFELGSVLAQQGDLAGAVARYRQALAASDERSVEWAILAHNNIAYHLHLLGDSAALAYARGGLSLAQEYGAIGLLPYLLSTLGEIALAQGDLATAERHFGEGLAMAERLDLPERVVGLGANLGLVAIQRGQTSLAIHRLSAALAGADALGTRHLAAQIRIWLAPLLPPDAARGALTEARAIAESGGRQKLLEQIEALESPPGEVRRGEAPPDNK